MKKHSLTKEFSAGMIAASLGMLSTASLSPKQVHASGITPVVAQNPFQQLSIPSVTSWDGSAMMITLRNLASMSMIWILRIFLALPLFSIFLLIKLV